MRIIICNDDIAFADQLAKSICSFFRNRYLKQPEIVIYDNGESLINDSETADIIFLEINMNGPAGLTICEKLRAVNERVIIFATSSSSEYLDSAMQMKVFRYLTKPIDEQRLFTGLQNALKDYNTTVKKIAIETKDGVYIVNTSEIIYIETNNNNLIVHTLKEDYVSVLKMNYWREELNYPDFFNCHRNYIINLKYVSSFDRYSVQLCNNRFKVYLTQRKYPALKNAYMLYLESMR